jgi:hypothetical protein
MVATASLFRELAQRGFNLAMGAASTPIFSGRIARLRDFRPIFAVAGRVAVGNLRHSFQLDLPGTKIVIGGGRRSRTDAASRCKIP